ncbi:contact-dependent growth inhibition system immunity protein [Aestuariibius insulae]|uniref:contact-dependent growth inhibition system immunity protein n=1 Tax=Aestuariibius insulae TaxID=2058287 RepID=UPI00345E1C84
MKHIDQKTLEELEGEIWPEPGFKSYLTTTCYQLRKKKLAEFTVEDLRIMLGQSIGARHLLPKALIVLKENPFADGDFFEGDLLGAISRYPENMLLLDCKDKEMFRDICKTVLSSCDDPLPEPDRTQVEELVAYLNEQLSK